MINPKVALRIGNQNAATVPGQRLIFFCVRFFIEAIGTFIAVKLSKEMAQYIIRRLN